MSTSEAALRMEVPAPLCERGWRQDRSDPRRHVHEVATARGPGDAPTDGWVVAHAERRPSASRSSERLVRLSIGVGWKPGHAISALADAGQGSELGSGRRYGGLRAGHLRGHRDTHELDFGGNILGTDHVHR